MIMAEAKRRSTTTAKKDEDEEVEPQAEGEEVEPESAEEANRSVEDEKNVQAAADRRAEAERVQTQATDPVFTQIDTTTLDDDKKAKDLQPRSGGGRREKFGSYNHGAISWPKPEAEDPNVGTPAHTVPKTDVL